MYCPNCGAEANGRFCPNCGAPLAQQPVEQYQAAPQQPVEPYQSAQQQYQSAQQQQEQAAPPKKPIYKRVWFWIVIALLALIVVIVIGSCGSTEQKAAASPEPTQAEAQDAESSAAAVPDETEKAEINIADITVEEQVVFEQGGIRITVKGLDTEDSFWGPALKVLIENDSTQDITVQVRNVSINGIMVNDSFSCEVAGGKKANDEISFLSDSLKLAGIDVLQKIELSFHIYDTASWDTLMDSEPILIETSADPAYVQPIDDSGYVALDQDGIKLVIKRLDSTDSFWGADVYVYVENNSPYNVTIQTRNVSINGFMIEPVFSCDILAGKKAFDSISIMQSDLDDNGITDITVMELSFCVFDMDTWDTIFDSDLISITF